MWLNDAMITNTCYNSSDPNVGLSLNSDFSTRKCYMMDTGLLITQTFLDNWLGISSKIDITLLS